MWALNTMFRIHGYREESGSKFFGDGFPRNFLSRFLLHGGRSSGFHLPNFPKFEETAKAVMGRRGE